MMLVAIAVLIFLLFNMNSKSGYAIVEREYSAFGAAPSNGPAAAPAASATACGMNKGTGLASSLLPREVASDEDFGEFAPEDILKGQNFLEPRQQVASPRLSVAPSATPTSRSGLILLTPRTPTFGTTLPLFPTPCSVVCALKD